MRPAWKCTSRAKSTGELCERDAIRGGKVCWVHGGAAPQVRKAAEQELERRRVSKLLARAALDPGQDPVEVLQSMVDTAAALKVVIENELGDADLERLTSDRGAALVKMLGEAIDRAAKWSATKAGLSLDERKMKVSEVTAGQLVSLVEVCGRQVGIPPTQIAALTKAIGAEARRRRDNR